jgi:ZIP family zinc transporter
MHTGSVGVAFGMTILAGLATGIGSALAFFARKTNTRFLAVALGFSAGVMIYVSLVEILAKARTTLSAPLGTYVGSWLAVLSFFFGIAVVAFIDKLVPSFENPHEMHTIEEMGSPPANSPENGKLMRMGVLSAFAIGIHNFPEGLATFAAALQNSSLGGAIAVAIGIHNIPEGIAVSIPIYFATGDRRKAFGYSFLSGISEPVGALVGYFLLRSFFNETVFGILFGMVAGIMVFISFDQLLPTAEEYGEHHLAVYGLIAGMAVMAVSLLLFL